MATRIDPELLEILCCPETHQALHEATDDQITQINHRIAAGCVKNRAGQAVTEAIEGALIRKDGTFLYPVRNKIPVLLIDEALPLEA